MMKHPSLLLAGLLLFAATPQVLATTTQDAASAPPTLETSRPQKGTPSLLAIQVAVAETVENGTLEHAVILVENGRIVTIGEDLPIERGIPILDRDPEWTVMPGLVNAYSRLGLDSRAGSEFKPQADCKAELYPEADAYDEVVEFGVTTLGLYPPGSSVAGQAIAIRPDGETVDEMVEAEGCYLKIGLRSNSSSKKALKKGFDKADQYKAKDDKAKAKWEKAQEKKNKKKSSKKKKDDKKMAEPPFADDEPLAAADDDDDKKKDKKKGEEYEPLAPDADVLPFLKLRAGELSALISIGRSADFKHFLDAKGEEEFSFDLRCPITRELDLFYVKDEIGEIGCRVVFEPTISLHPGTMRQRNLPAEFAAAGAKLVLIPRSDSLSSHETWLLDVGRLVSSGLDRQTALRAITLEPASMLGMEEEVGSLAEGKRADMVFFNGDPFEAGTQVEAVMIDGHFVMGGGAL